jgi:hypothetical protein
MEIAMMMMPIAGMHLTINEREVDEVALGAAEEQLHIHDNLVQALE